MTLELATVGTDTTLEALRSELGGPRVHRASGEQRQCAAGPVRLRLSPSNVLRDRSLEDKGSDQSGFSRFRKRPMSDDPL